MNWICKFFIVLSCFAAFMFSSAPSLVAARSAQVSTEENKVVKKRSVRQGRSRLAKKVNSAQTKRVVKQSRRHRDQVANYKEIKQESSTVALVDGSGSAAHRITARSVMVMDAVTGAAIYAQASDTPAQPASTIKVLTGVISLDVLRKNELVEVSRRAAMMPRSKVYLNPGRKYPADDLINAVLLASANDASVALAEKIGGSEQVFAKLMTAKARSFGATNTVCKTANGLTASGQYTTAQDLAKIFNNAMRNNEFASKMAVTEVANTDGKVIRSHNRALWQVDGAEGGKTGYTQEARRTYVGKFKRDNDEIVVALMGSENMWGDLKTLVEYGFTKKRQERGSMATAKPSADPSVLVRLGNSSRQLPIAVSL